MSKPPHNADSIDCPPQEEWWRALQGTLDPVRLQIVEDHLLECSSCELTVDALTEQSDTFVRELCRQPAVETDEPAYRALYGNLVSTSESGFVQRTLDPPTSSLPMKLGNYRLESPLGHGANGSVYFATHVPLGRPVAIKLLRPNLDFDQSRIDSFMTEVRAVAQLDHPNLIRATDAGEADGRHFLAMEYVPGLDLSSMLVKAGELKVADACEMARQAAAGLQHLHENGFVHRDVKPSNLLLTGNGQVKLLDLGLVQSVDVHSPDRKESEASVDGARHNDEPINDSHADVGWPTGTPDYMPPEQWHAVSTADPRSDLYSLGCTLFKLLTGAPPYRPLPAGVHDRCEAHCNSPAPEVGRFRSDVSDGLQKVINRLLAKNPDDRFASAGELIETLSPFCLGADPGQVAVKVDLPSTEEFSASHPQVKPVVSTVGTPGSGGPMTRRTALASIALGMGGLAAGAWGVRRVLKRTPKVKTGIWRPLSIESPAVLLGDSTTDAAASSSVYESDADQIIIRSESRTLMNLGRPLLGRYQLRTELQQSNPVGRFGVFFAYRRPEDDIANSVDGDSPFRVYQTIELVPVADRIEWAILQAARTAEGRWVTSTSELLASVAATIPATDDWHSMQLRIGATGFPAVTINGETLAQSQWQVTAAGHRQAAVSQDRLPHEFLGHLGLVSEGAQSSFRRTQLAYDDADSQGTGGAKL